ncbi:hypothetical protein QYE76_048636 [Lolium multiflorum]|uniref:Ribonuclease H n=1 Tax=Lolium multiflorum TaxID=4521 RepID=A0AAD8SLE9_LOLMU|nr:hypothetical protein QYE76_048636 [Lolium multiflorum]
MNEVEPWVDQHINMIKSRADKPMTEQEVFRAHNSSFASWFKDQIDANPPPMASDVDKMILALSYGPAPNLMTYQKYDINGYTFYTEEKDMKSDYQNSGVTMESYTGEEKRRPNRVGTTRDIITAVDAKTGIPTEPKHVAKGYGLQLGAILRDVVDVNETKLRTKKKQHLQAQLLARLHARYEFPVEYRNEDTKDNIVNRRALSKFSKNLSGYKTMLRGMLGDNETWEEIQRHFPRMTLEQYNKFLENEELEYTKRQSTWGKELADKNIGHHNLGCRGFEGKQPVWDKEDQAYINAGLEPPFAKYKDPLFRAYLRSRYHRELAGKRVTKPDVVVGVELVADAKVMALEKAVLTEQAAAESAGSSSQTSTGKVPWDTPFIRGLNTVKARPLLDKPHRVPGAGGGRKLADYGLDVPASTRSRGQWGADDREHEALLKKVADLETTMEQRVSAEVDDALANRVNEIIPDLVLSMKNYFDAGGKGPMPVISLGASNSDNRPPTRHAQCTPNLVTPPAGNVGAREDSPDLGGPSTSPSVTCTPGLGPSTRAELDALTANATPCTLLLNVDNKLKAVASGSVILPTQRIFHCVRMDDSVSRVRVNRSLPGCQDLHPPYQPPETETPLTLGDLKNHILLWPKALIRLNTAASGSEASTRCTDALSQAKVPAPTTALTAGKGRASPPPAYDHFEPDSQPDSQHESQHDKALDIDQAPIDTFIAELDADAVSPYKPPAGHILKKKLFLSQETPEQEDTTAFTAPPRVGLTPRTLLGATTEGMKQNATPSCSKKKGRKRKKSGDVAKSKIVVNDKLPTPWRKLHHIGQPMLPAHVVDKLITHMRNVHDTILMKEKLLLKERNPSYPIVIAKVPTGFGFVNTYPADLMFIRLKYCTLLLFHPYHSHVTYLDSGLDKEKDFTDVKSTLDKALSGFIAEIGVDKLRHEKKVKGCHVCNHITKFPCLKQSADDNGMEAWFAILQMRAVVRSQNDLLLPSGLQGNFVNMSDTTDENMTYYVVYHGRVPGVYEDWEDCRRQVHRFSGNSYKGYTTLEEAETRYANFRAGQRREMWRTPFIVMMLAATASLVYYVIVV